MRNLFDFRSIRGRRHRAPDSCSLGAPRTRRAWLLVCCVSAGMVCIAMIPPSAAQAAPSVWSVTRSPNAGQGFGQGANELFGVSCFSSTFCMAVGYFYFPPSNQTLVEKWDGSTWMSGSSAGEGDFGVLDAVSCTSPTSCVAVGYDSASGNDQTLAESWNGTTWSITPTPDPGGTYDELEGVSCTSASSCIAVGVGPNGTLVESWDGSTWSVVPSPSEGDGSSLASVSCTSAAQCEAVGSYSVDTDLNQTLAESWDGSAWSITPSPSPGPGHGTEFLGVSCPTTSNCVAVGYYGAFDKPLVESWDGSTWSVVHSPNPTARDGAELFGVSCLKSKDCVAVGGYYPGTHSEKTLVESWNGSSWSITPSPSPEGTDNAVNPIPELDGVSCTKSTACVAVGHYLNSSKVKTLVETGS